jgi:hypothetical protein
VSGMLAAWDVAGVARSRRDTRAQPSKHITVTFHSLARAKKKKRCMR